jgi:hypothetical protein
MKLDRRNFLLAAGAAAALLPAPAEAAPATERLLRQAMSRLGGRRVLERVRLLSWDGEAMVHDGSRDIAIGVSTMVVPFVAARSASWPLAQGRGATRTMVLNADVARVERNGTSEDLPPDSAAHERAQFGMYGIMLIAPIAGGKASLRFVPNEKGMTVLRVARRFMPVTFLYFEADGRLAEARNEVPDPEGGAPIPQHFYFSEEVMPGPVRWPRSLRIEQRGKPYFELKLSRFEASH